MQNSQVPRMFKWSCHNRLCAGRSIHHQLSLAQLQVGHLHVESSEVRFNLTAGFIYSTFGVPTKAETLLPALFTRECNKKESASGSHFLVALFDFLWN